MTRLTEYGPARGSEVETKPSATSRGEDGRLHNDNIEYVEEPKKVTAKLSSYNSQIYTNLAKKLEEIKQLSDQIAQLKEEVKQDTREHVAELFSVADETRTRVVETVSFSIKLSAKPKATESYKYAEIVKALESELTPELLTVLTALKERFKTVTQKEASISVELKEGLWDKIVSGVKSLVGAIRKWFVSYDKKLEKLQADFKKLEINESIEEIMADEDADYLLESDTYQLGAETYQIKGRITGLSLASGMRVLASDKRVELPYEIIDFLDRKDGKRYKSVKELMAHYGVKSLSALEKETEVYINCKDLEDQTSGDWFYLFNGRWCIGSSADVLSFILLGSRINEAGELKVLGENNNVVTEKEMLAECAKADVYVVVVPHISDVTSETPLMYVKGLNLDGTDCTACSSTAEALEKAGVDSLEELDAPNVLTMIASDEDGNDIQVWYQDGVWMTVDGEVKVYATKKEDFAQSGVGSYAGIDLVSKWESASGAELYLVKDSDGRAYVTNAWGAVYQRNANSTVDEFVEFLTSVGAKQVPAGDIGGDVAKAINESLVDPEDAFPIPATLDDSEVEIFMARWEIDKRFVDKHTPEGEAYSKFGAELEREAEARALA